jgi:hypothetical protein
MEELVNRRKKRCGRGKPKLKRNIHIYSPMQAWNLNFRENT